MYEALSTHDHDDPHRAEPSDVDCEVEYEEGDIEAAEDASKPSTGGPTAGNGGSGGGG